MRTGPVLWPQRWVSAYSAGIRPAGKVRQGKEKLHSETMDLINTSSKQRQRVMLLSNGNQVF